MPPIFHIVSTNIIYNDYSFLANLKFLYISYFLIPLLFFLCHIIESLGVCLVLDFSFKFELFLFFVCLRIYLLIFKELFLEMFTRFKFFKNLMVLNA